jgi:hypothetical protein
VVEDSDPSCCVNGMSAGAGGSPGQAPGLNVTASAILSGQRGIKALEKR